MQKYPKNRYWPEIRKKITLTKITRYMIGILTVSCCCVCTAEGECGTVTDDSHHSTGTKSGRWEAVREVHVGWGVER